MGRRGPAPKPTEVKLMEGTYRADRAPLNEPKARVSLPPCPSWLSLEAKKEYRRVGKLLVTMRIMTDADRSALAAYCQAYARWKEAEAEMSAPGFQMVKVTDKGYYHTNPWLGISHNAVKQMKIFMAELGLTPASRSRIEAQPQEEKPISMANKLFAAAGVSLEE